MHTTYTFSYCDVGMLSYGDKMGIVSYSSIEWVANSVAICNATPCKEFFTVYKTRDFGKIKMDNKSSVKVVGVGDVCMKTYIGCMLTLKNMLHIFSLRLNLISTLVLHIAEYYNHFGGEK